MEDKKITTNQNANKYERIVFDNYEAQAEDLIENGLRSEWWYIVNKAMSDWSLLSLADIKGKDVLNIGCWEPIDEMMFARHVRSWTAIDVSPKGIEVAKKIVERELSSELARKISFVVGDARALPFSDEHFDVVVSFSTIEHIPDAKDRFKVLQEMARVTKKRGQVIVTTSNRWSIPYRLVSQKLQKEGKAYYGFEYFYSFLELKNDLKRVGLKPGHFTSDWQPRIAGGGWPRALVSRFLMPLKYFGPRMGYIAHKP